MQSHQRYFPIVRDGGLDSRGSPSSPTAATPDVVVAGNEEVLVGRLEDAEFALGKDIERGLDAMLAELPRVSFLEGAGSLAEKSERVRQVSGQLCDRVEAEPEVRDAVARAAELCKADLVSSLVSEFSDLQGYAGSLYARRNGEREPVVAARSPSTTCRWRRAASCPPPRPARCCRSPTRPTPWRSPSPLACSRPAAGIPTACAAPPPASSPSRSTAATSWGWSSVMAESVHMLVAQGHELKRKPLEAVPDAVDFVLDRVEPLMAEEGVSVEELRAARGSGVTGPLPLAALSRALRDARGGDELAALRDAYGRCVRIAARGAEEAASEVLTRLFESEAERSLCAALSAADVAIADAAALRDYGGALAAAGELVDPINAFFDEVMVMADDPAVRGNRLKLVADVASTLRLVGDFEQLPG